MEQNSWRALLPSPKVAAVEKGLQSAFATTSVDSITPLAGGLSTALVYKIVVHGKPYVLRIIMHVDALNDPARQFTCMRLAADAGIAPPVYYSDAQDAVAIIALIETVPMWEHFPSRDALLCELAQTVKAIHATPLFPKLVNFMDGVDGFIERFKTSKTLPESATAEHLRYYAQIQQMYPRHDPDVVSSHNDLNYNNFLFDGKRFWVIDWEAAFQNDRFVDLANVANGFVTSEAEEEVYLRAYFGDALDDTKRARFFLMQQTCHFFYAMIMLSMVEGQLPPGAMHDDNMETPRYADFRKQIGAGEVTLASYEGQLMFAKVVLNEALHNMKSARFAGAIEQVKALSSH
jgi:thiamine kinase-like enzyme